jgi:hypothetical protein
VANRVWLLFSCVLLLIVLCISEIPNTFAVDELKENTWTVLPEQEKNNVLGVRAVDDKIYTFCYSHTEQKTAQNIVNIDTYIYDCTTNAWSTSAQHFNVDPSQWWEVTPVDTVVIGNKIYCFGYGICDESILNNKVYDTSTGYWSSITPSPNSKARPSVSVVNNKIYMIGGANQLDIAIYDPNTGIWEIKPMNQPIISSVTISLENKIYLFADDKIQIYDTLSDTWRTISGFYKDINFAYFVPGGATTGKYAPQKIYLFGTHFWPTPNITTCIFDPKTEQCSKDWGFPVPEKNAILKNYRPFDQSHGWYEGFHPVVVNDIFYLIGGGFTFDDGASTSYRVDFRYVPLGYSVPSQSDGKEDGSLLSFTVAGVVVAVAVVAVAAVAVFRFRHKTVKVAKSP